MLAPLLDPVKGVVHGTEFSGIARGAPSAKPMRAGGGRGHWAPNRACVGSAREGDVNPPAGRSGGESRAVSEEESRRIIEQGVPGSPGPVDFTMYSSAFFRVENLFTSAGIPTV